MSPTLNSGPAFPDAPSSGALPEELLVVRKLDHFMTLHEKYGWRLPDMAQA
jgi:hypothetical protein